MRRSKRRVFQIATWLFLPLFGGTANCQVAAAQPQFDAASLKLVPAGRGGAQSIRSDPARIDYRNIPLRRLIFRAYGLIWSYQVVWPQGWNDNNAPSYDLTATLPAGATEEQIPAMLRALLAERFELKTHRETRELPVFALTVAKSGLKMRKAEATPSQGGVPAADPPAPFSVFQSRDAWRIMGRMPLITLVSRVSSFLDRPLVDLTGLEGDYNLSLEFSRETASPPDGGAGVATGGDGPPSAGIPIRAAAPALIAAMEKQLGLKVEARKIPLDVLVIDHLNRIPSEN